MAAMIESRLAPPKHFEGELFYEKNYEPDARPDTTDRYRHGRIRSNRHSKAKLKAEERQKEDERYKQRS